VNRDGQPRRPDARPTSEQAHEQQPMPPAAPSPAVPPPFPASVRPTPAGGGTPPPPPAVPSAAGTPPSPSLPPAGPPPAAVPLAESSAPQGPPPSLPPAPLPPAAGGTPPPPPAAPSAAGTAPSPSQPPAGPAPAASAPPTPNPWHPAPGILRPLLRACWLIARTRPLHVAAYLALAVLPGALLALQVVVQRSVFAAGLALPGGAPFGPFLAAATAYVAVSLGVWLLTSARGVFNWLISNGIQSALTEAYLAHTARLRMEVRLHPAYHDLHGRVRAAASREPGDNVVLKLMTLFRYCLQAAGIAAGLFVLSPVLAIAAAIATLPSFLDGVRVTWWTRALALDQSRRQNRLRYLEELLTTRAAAPEVRAFGLGEHLLGRWRDLLRGLQAERWALELRARPVAIALYIASDGLLGYALGVLWALWLVAHGRLGVAAFAAAAAALATFRSNLETIIVHVSLTHGQTLELADLFAFLDAPLAERDAPVGRPFPSPLRHGMAVEGLGFTYPGAAAPALRGVTFHLAPGETVALVGPNGAGKSTLVRCLLGLYRPMEGGVAFDGVPQEAIAAASLRAHVAAVFQEHARFRLTMREGVGFGRVEALHDEAAVLAAVHRGDAVDLLSGLPAGLDTWLDRARPGGVDLSGGQWQRVAVARAFMRQADVLVLDEPTAALDPQAEAEVFRSFVAMAQGRTAVLVSHRLGFARLADRILVLNGGRLAEEGTHSALLARGGLYAEMWAAQAQWYAG